MWPKRNYLEDAKKHEEVFRNILRNLKIRPESLDPESPLEQIFEKYSTGSRYGIWTILDFKRGPSDEGLAKLSDNEALFASEDIACLSGSGRVDKYKVKPDNSIEFDSNIINWRS